MLKLKELHSYPKIFSLGSPELEDLFKSPVEITEKIDGSMIRFARIDGEVVVGSKGVNDIIQRSDKMFNSAVEYLLSQKRNMRDNTIYYGEYLDKPKHNTLSYEKIPKNHIALFGVKELTGDGTWKWVKNHGILVFHAQTINVDAVPLLYWGDLKDQKRLESLLEKPSFLGNEKIEGVVIKNYKENSTSRFSSECYGKYVNEKFKERNKGEWKKKRPTVEDFLKQFQNEARWEKAFQHLRDDGKITYQIRDIGELIKSVHNDILIEDEAFIKQELFKFYKKQILGTAVRGLPDWWKKKLMAKQFEEKNEKDSKVSSESTSIA